MAATTFWERRFEILSRPAKRDLYTYCYDICPHRFSERQNANPCAADTRVVTRRSIMSFFFNVYKIIIIIIIIITRCTFISGRLREVSVPARVSQRTRFLILFYARNGDEQWRVWRKSVLFERVSTACPPTPFSLFLRLRFYGPAA